MRHALGNTLQLLSISWQILRKDRELCLLPLMCGGVLFLVFAYTGAALWAGGTFERIGPDYRFYLADLIFVVLAYCMASFVIVYFNAAIVAAAHQRLEGWEADIRTGLNTANDRLGSLFIWSVMAGTVGLFLHQLSDSRSLLGKHLGFVLDVVWGYVTLFVVPGMVVEGAGATDALARSTDLFKQTWGKSYVATFGFGVAYFAVAIVAALPAALLLMLLGPAAAAVAAAAVFLMGVAFVQCCETIFVVALYDYAVTGRANGEFPDYVLRGAYAPKPRLKWQDRPALGGPSW
ncbi:MAG TPA: DUF6159 family protein [Dehalococcoidia bacterium]|nr:DUF6159 family protein [Dehalococcoidia bacterium]